MKESYRYWNYTQLHLHELGIHETIVMNMYNQNHRFYHNWSHIEDLLSQLEKRGRIEDDTLYLATIFHDAIYDPKADDNEERSAALFEQMYKGSNMTLKNEVINIILETKTHKPNSEPSKIFCEMDMDILSRPLDKLIEYENKIFKEFQCYDWKKYKVERVKVLRSLQKSSELEPLISYIESRNPNIGIYYGTFDPFHRGHGDVLLKAERIFDKVIIARDQNPRKTEPQTFNLPDKIKHRQIENYRGLITAFIDILGYDVTLIHGLRNATDFQYKVTKYRFLQDIKPDIKVVSIFCDREFEHISSSELRQLKRFNEHNKYLFINE